VKSSFGEHLGAELVQIAVRYGANLAALVSKEMPFLLKATEFKSLFLALMKSQSVRTSGLDPNMRAPRGTKFD
jgi:hypothetical protein